MNRPVSWRSTSALPDRHETPQNTSFENQAEADLILQWLEDFENQCRQRNLRPEVGIISGYQAQVGLITRLVDPANAVRWQNIQIEVATVDSFQGRECDVILYSTVRSNQQRNIGFQRDSPPHQCSAVPRPQSADYCRRRFYDAKRGDRDGRKSFAKVLQHIQQNRNECEIVQASQGAR